MKVRGGYRSVGLVLLAILVGGNVHAQVPHVQVLRHLDVTGVKDLAFTPDGRRLLLATGASIHLVDPQLGTVVRSFAVGGDRLRFLAPAGNGSAVFFLSGRRRVGVLDLLDGTVAAVWDVPKNINWMSASPTAPQVIVGGDDGFVQTRSADLGGGLRYRAPNLYGKDVAYVAFGRDGTEIIAVSGDGRTAMWSVGKEDPYRESSPPRTAYRWGALDGTGRFLAFSEEKTDLVRSLAGLHARTRRVLRFYDWDRGRDLREVEGLGHSVGPLAWGPEGRAVFVVLDGEDLGVLSIDQGDVAWRQHVGRVTSMAATADGSRLALADDQSGVTILGASADAPRRAVERPVAPPGLLQREKFEFTTPSDPLISSGETITLAVLGFANRNTSADMASAAGDFIVSQLANRSNVRLVERAAIDKVLAEVRFENNGLTSAEDAAKIGRMLNASTVLLGSLSALGESMVASVRMVETESARVLGAREIVCNRCTPEDVPSLAALLAKALVDPGS